MPCDSAYLMLFYPFDRTPKKIRWCFSFKKKVSSFDSNASTVVAKHSSS